MTQQTNLRHSARNRFILYTFLWGCHGIIPAYMGIDKHVCVIMFLVSIVWMATPIWEAIIDIGKVHRRIEARENHIQRVMAMYYCTRQAAEEFVDN